ncbi:hypothetical protein P5G50_01225 [Leifsonia sp. F6_8S_P_1B]|uniref:Uncharacterized protein n=1 Tax=Leifsonia williamsii TaxID=3035919 RepID=A0ABT8K6G7_9MICO|nr:hypothetical protein [Leifsonia williamsii]MDN4613058.1 hypothetical protein [Leifsonia williamsii]
MDAPPPVRPTKLWDVITTTVLLVVGLVVAAILTFFAFFLVFASDPCGSSTPCDTGRMGIGFFVALLGPGAVTLVAIVVAIVLLVRRRIAFWAPLAGILLAIGVWIGGAALVISGVPGATF